MELIKDPTAVDQQIAVNQKEIVDKWNAVGSSEGLASDSDIAEFLISLYPGGKVGTDGQGSVDVECQQCQQCRGPLTLYCGPCHLLFPQALPSHQAPPPAHQPSASSYQALPSSLAVPSIVYLQSLPGQVSGDIHDIDKDVDSKLSLLSLIRAHEASAEAGGPSTRASKTNEPSQESIHEEEDCHEDSGSEQELLGGAKIHFGVKKRAQQAAETVMGENAPVVKKRRTLTTSNGGGPNGKKRGRKPGSKSAIKPAPAKRGRKKGQGVKRRALTVSLRRCEEEEEGEEGNEDDEALPLIKALKTHACTFCLKRYDTDQQLKAHLRCNHGPFVCGKCGKSYDVYISYDWHVRTSATCRPDHSFECDLCGIVYRTEHNLQRHKRKMHGGNAALTCTVCLAPCPTMRVRRNHIKKHARERSVSQCEYCGVQIKGKQSMKAHIALHRDEKPYPCPKCDKRFRSTSVRSAHMVGHHSALARPFRCDQCDKGFIKADNLKYHMYSHTGEKPYRCELCPSAFARGDYLHKHMRTHTGEKPYRCGRCDAKFAYPNTLKAHELKHHGGGVGNGGDVSSSKTGGLLDAGGRAEQPPGQRFMFLQPGGLLLPSLSSVAVAKPTLCDREAAS